MKILFGSIFMVVLASVFIIKNNGYNPKPILVMKPSEYQSLTGLGQSLLRRFFKESELSPYIYVVCKQTGCLRLDLWKGFLQASKKNNLKPRNIYFSESLKNRSNLFEQGILFTENTMLSQRAIIFLQENEVALENLKNQENLFFYMTNFFLKRTSEPVAHACEDVSAFKKLSCLSLFFSRDFYKKKLSSNKFYVGMNRISSNKYVIYFNQ